MNTQPYLEGQKLYGGIYALSAHKTTPSGSENVEYSTIDGVVITQNDCAHAVSNGSGIFIGDYFVGLTESNNVLSGVPFIRY